MLFSSARRHKRSCMNGETVALTHHSTNSGSSYLKSVMAHLPPRNQEGCCFIRGEPVTTPWVVTSRNTLMPASCAAPTLPCNAPPRVDSSRRPSGGGRDSHGLEGGWAAECRVEHRGVDGCVGAPQPEEVRIRKARPCDPEARHSKLLEVGDALAREAGPGAAAAAALGAGAGGADEAAAVRAGPGGGRVAPCAPN